MNRRSFLKNTIGALLYGLLPFNKSLAKLVENTPDKSLNVLLYLIQTKSGDWKVRATKWTDLNKEKLRYSEYNIETFKPLTIIDNKDVKFFQKKYVEQYKAVNSLHSVDHYQCTLNGINYPISKQCTFESRSKGGQTNVKNNHIQTLGKEWGTICGKKYGKNNIKYTKTKEAIAKQALSASTPILQCDLNGNIIKEWHGMQEAGRNGFIVSAISKCCNNIPKHKTHRGFIWKFK